MVKFGQRLAYEAKRLPESWGDFLLDYEQLKRRLETAIEMEKSSENLPGTTSQVIAESTRNSFQHLLDSELEKMLAKYKLCLAVLVNNVDALKRETRNASRMIQDSASARLHGWAQSDDGQSVTADKVVLNLRLVMSTTCLMTIVSKTSHLSSSPRCLLLKPPMVPRAPTILSLWLRTLR